MKTEKKRIKYTTDVDAYTGEGDQRENGVPYKVYCNYPGCKSAIYGRLFYNGHFEHKKLGSADLRNQVYVCDEHEKKNRSKSCG